MRAIFIASFLAAACVCAAASDQATTRTITPDELAQTIAAAQQSTDGDLAQKLAGLELTARLSDARLADLSAKLPGDKSRLALLLLADHAIFLPPPADEVPSDPAPDAPATRQMLVKVVGYVNTTVRQLPNLMATRTTTGFEDRPQEERLTDTGVMSLGYLPLHWVGSLSMEVTYRDRQEVEDKSVKAKRDGSGVKGLVTSGEFGPILSTVMADALKGKITWARWEKHSDATLAVFHYEVPVDKSHYDVQFCCLLEDYAADGRPNQQLFDERSAYEGDIVFNPADGSIRFLTLQAERPEGGLVSGAGIAIEYAPTAIAGRPFICPVKSVSLLQAHTAAQSGAFSRSDYKGPAKTFLNDVKFSNYRRFGSEVKIITDSAGD
jgi:hypothetical protein